MTYENIISSLQADSLPSYEEISDLTQAFSEILENEDKPYRPMAQNLSTKELYPGSLLDFQEDDLPLIVIPDLHARPEFLLNILNYQFSKKETVWNLLEKGEIRIICVGDALHSESARTRWSLAEVEFNSGEYTGPSIQKEMIQGLAILCAIIKLKLTFPSNFHFLKGNHENILNQTGGGDYGFRKYADEGEMVKQFIANYYGEDILYLIHCAEVSLPLIAVSKNCVVSHAEPRAAYTKEQLINAREDSFVVEGLTWTDNYSAQKGSVAGIINELAKTNAADFVYFAGHRPVEGNYNLKQDGRFIQIHNPRRQNIAIIYKDVKFDPEKHIVNVDNKKEGEIKDE